MVQAIVLLAEGTEEMEFAISYDVLVRAGIEVKSVYVPAEGKPNTPEQGFVTAARGVKIVPDTTLAQISNELVDVVVVPGGVGGAKILAQDRSVLQYLKQMFDAKRLVAAICAGSLAPLHAGIGLHGKITSHPSVKDQLKDAYDYQEQAVVVTDHLITSRGPGTTFLFALAIVEKLMGEETRAKVAEPMMLEEHL
ncbi:protein deglycase [Malassezia yamatoensis]|uniref:D-lactate dehydratase n=1 Tax=Malassezia yamatoensis TaxID=253288 RepID=A0AAJ5YZJ5_9BASI|nr:protein deglycase [Malassezia yamatoensis]